MVAMGDREMVRGRAARIDTLHARPAPRRRVRAYVERPLGPMCTYAPSCAIIGRWRQVVVPTGREV